MLALTSIPFELIENLVINQLHSVKGKNVYQTVNLQPTLSLISFCTENKLKQFDKRIRFPINKCKQ